MTSRICSECLNPLIQFYGESNKSFAMRRTCSSDCNKRRKAKYNKKSKNGNVNAGQETRNLQRLLCRRLA